LFSSVRARFLVVPFIVRSPFVNVVPAPLIVPPDHVVGPLTITSPGPVSVPLVIWRFATVASVAAVARLSTPLVTRIVWSVGAGVRFTAPPETSSVPLCGYAPPTLTVAPEPSSSPLPEISDVSLRL
jgi:hypothetical protein